MARRKTDRLSALERAGFRTGEARKNSYDQLVEASHKNRIEAFVYTHPSGTSRESTEAAHSCPRCGKDMNWVRLASEEKAGYCVPCRYTLPVPQDD